MTTTPDPRIIPGMDRTPTDMECELAVHFLAGDDMADRQSVRECEKEIAEFRVIEWRKAIEWVLESIRALNEFDSSIPIAVVVRNWNERMSAHDAAVAERKNEGRDVQ